MKGVMMLVTLSPILYAAWVASGEIPDSMNMGMNTGATSAHIADALPISRLMTAVSTTKLISSKVVPGLSASSSEAPLMAEMMPSWLQAK